MDVDGLVIAAVPSVESPVNGWLVVWNVKVEIKDVCEVCGHNTNVSHREDGLQPPKLIRPTSARARWHPALCQAVSNEGRFGRWIYRTVRQPPDLMKLLTERLQTGNGRGGH